jgi:asparagine synthase (glutamine-hydrolysing)
MEAEWQERVVEHVGVDDWLRLDLVDELDAVGSIARRGLERHGLLWPFNVHFHTPLAEAAAGGSLVTGIGGDEVFSRSRWALADDVLSGRARASPRDVLPVALALSPPAIRRIVLRGRHRSTFSWLRPSAQRALARVTAAEEAEEPRRYGARLALWRRRRTLAVGLHSLSLLGADSDTLLVHPLTTVAVADSLASAAPTRGPIDRGSFMNHVFGDLVPPDLYARRSKASFDEAFWREEARELAARWDGEGASIDLVDPVQLRCEWSREVPDAHTLTLLQAAWLEGRRASVAVR